MTGLTRKEVRRIRDKTEKGDEIGLAKLTPMSQVMHRWYTEDEFTSANGAPLVLDFDSGGPSFSNLVKKFGGDIPPGAMRTELKRVGAVQELESGQLKAVSRSVVGIDDHEKLVRGLVHVLYPAALAMDHNISTNGQNDSWVHMSAYTKYVRNDDLSRIRRVSSDRAVSFVESVDDFLAAYETMHESPKEQDNGKAVGIGVFYFEEDTTESDVFK
jgi:hypothetical protein